MKIKKSDLLAVMIFSGFKSATTWDDEKIVKRVPDILQLVQDDSEQPSDPKLAKTFNDVVAAIKRGEEFEMIDDSKDAADDDGKKDQKESGRPKAEALGFTRGVSVEYQGREFTVARILEDGYHVNLLDPVKDDIENGIDIAELKPWKPKKETKSDKAEKSDAAPADEKAASAEQEEPAGKRGRGRPKKSAAAEASPDAGDAPKTDKAVEPPETSAPAAKTAKAKLEKQKPVGVRAGITAPFSAGQVLKEFGIHVGVNAEMIERYNSIRGVENDSMAMQNLVRAWHVVRGYVTNIPAAKADPAADAE